MDTLNLEKSSITDVNHPIPNDVAESFRYLQRLARRNLAVFSEPARRWGFLRLRPDGSFILAGALHENNSIWRAEYDPQGMVSILSISGTTWREATVRTGHSRWRPNRLCLLQAARSNGSGGIEARSTRLSFTGAHEKRALAVGAEGGRRWTFEERFADGSRLEGEGEKEKGGPASVVQRRLTKTGDPIWDSTSKSSSPLVDSGVRTIHTATTFADGAKASSIRIVMPPGSPLSTRSESNYDGGSFGASSSEESAYLNNDGSYTTETVTTYPDGSMTITTVTEGGGQRK